jgi:arsenate reductase-like glutaredoxin family protein
MEVQVFGTRKSADSRKALRFFAERRVKVHFVDLVERAASPGELRRFLQKLGIDALLDRTSPRFADLGLQPPDCPMTPGWPNWRPSPPCFDSHWSGIARMSRLG